MRWEIEQLFNQKFRYTTIHRIKEQVLIVVKIYYNGYAFVPQCPLTTEINQDTLIIFFDDKTLSTLKAEQLLNLARNISLKTILR
jgi:hypothetical protein